MIWLLLAPIPALRPAGTQGPLGARRVNNGALLSDGRTGNSEDNGVSGHVQAAAVQGTVAHWGVRGAAARNELRAQNHGEASFSGGVQPTEPVYRAMGGNPQPVPVQGSVQGSSAAKAAWLARQETPSWGKGAASAAPAAASPVASAWQGSVVQGRVPVPGRVQASVQPVQGSVQGTWQGSVQGHVPVQGSVVQGRVPVQGSVQRSVQPVHGGQEAAEATRDLAAPLPRAARTGNSEDAHPQAAPVQGSVRAWSVRGAAERKRLREGN